MEKELFEMVAVLLSMLDPDEVCEKGRSCGKCGNCKEFNDIETRFYNMSDPRQPENSYYVKLFKRSDIN